MTEIELAALVEQYTGLTDRTAPPYAQAYRLAHAAMTATLEGAESRIAGYRFSSVEQWRRKKEWQGRCSALAQRIEELETAFATTNKALMEATARPYAALESGKDFPSPAPEDEPCR